MAATPRTRPEIRLEPMTAADLPELAAGNLEAFPTFYAPLEPESRRPPHDVRVRRFAHRLSSVLSSPHVFATKAVLASSGALVAIALWHRPGAPVRNTKRRGLLGGAPEGESAADREAWEHVDLEAHERVWREWDETRERIMGDVPHWYLVPIWVKPAYQGLGIGKALMQQVIDLCDAQSPPTPIFLEADKRGMDMYRKLGFVEVGSSEYVEMVRYNKEGTRPVQH
ncbi:uncharacterized protein RHOBADRAFT_43247 [Rhodotorula graminis WP1]|uniref:N-acetyltransferase domain-containing protein n=1 Tax=Rhodotorula graminis (strain WP1) TaxID=578459 RepID=A0A194S509_RHOGW|nr:uncharacterized protein RHOBADRAFT_43247 [Rhodotorula graminis WP1]KPV75823.1 hypothetical protein RHOBADRAFT_43247 [Rhodotorula graminis WP1]